MSTKKLQVNNSINDFKRKRYQINKVKISIVNIKQSIQLIDQAINDGHRGYICVTNSRTTYLANKDDSYCSIQNNSLLTLPDGAPLVWIAHNLRYYGVGRVSGKDLMDALFEISKEKRYSHYFYGGAQRTIDLMKANILQRYPDLKIKGAVSPPFQPLESFDIDALAKEINELRPSFFWCGLGAPKQERLIAALQPKLHSTISVGVGLAFDYFAGQIKRSPRWMQYIGMEWLYRLIQQPKKVVRAILPFSYVLKYLIKSIIIKNEYTKLYI
jgi:N-acetylglucosaminyldiphosphoundecaprenol N-acetyl-beta-D-mannosaminyltransferase